MPQKTTTLTGHIIDEWTFKNADTQYLTHGLHPYPARMIPQLADKLIRKYSEEKDWVLDPFCGSGTVLAECRLKNRNSIGNEINPFAVLLSKVKTTPLEKMELRRISEKVLNEAKEEIMFYRNKRSKDKLVSIEKWMGKDIGVDVYTNAIQHACKLTPNSRGVNAIVKIHVLVPFHSPLLNKESCGYPRYYGDND